MTRHRRIALPALLLVASSAPSMAARDRPGRSSAPAAPAAPAASAVATPAAEPPHARFAWPGGGRAELELPAEAWREVAAQGGLPARPLGMTFEEMRHFGRDRLLLRGVETMFRDARTVPRTAGRLTDEMLAAADPAKLSVAELVRQGYALTDAVAARFYPGPTATTWGVTWMDAEATPAQALDAALDRCAPAARTVERRERAALHALPEAVQRALARLLAGADAAAPWIDLAFAGQPAQPAPPPELDALHARASAPWRDDGDQSATASRSSFELLETTDREYLAYGSVVFLLHADLAVAELRAWSATAEGMAALAAMPEASVACATRFGDVRVSGAAADAHARPAFLDLDLGGDDRWTGRHGVPQPPARRIALALDLSGDDTWEGGTAALGFGIFGLGAVVDCAGKDTWRVDESGLGAGLFGTGVLADLGGNDTYVVRQAWGQGAAHAGVGLLLDLAGDDTYECARESQGLGSTLGAGVLIDLAGDDRYVARDDGNVSELYLGQSVAMAQGCGYGRRADIGDGHSLAGGFGVLLDGAGDDVYHAQVWAQGAAYWWSCGILEDRGGDDRYENGKYSLGAAAHFAVGSFVDLTGDDTYNAGVGTAVNQFHGHARDGSIGIALDGDGDDAYFFRSHCGGSADLDSVAVFWDRRGDDRYDVAPKDLGPPDGWNETPPMGSATWYPPYRSFRDDVPTVGVFLDTGGADARSEQAPGGDDRAWTRPHAPASFGVGMDVEWYPSAKPDAR